MSLHPELFPSEQCRAFEIADSSFREMIENAHNPRVPIDKATVISNFSQLLMKGALAVGTGNGPELRYGLYPDRFVETAQAALIDVVVLNNMNLVQPPIDSAELAVLEHFVDHVK